ncbi:nuclear pore complex protein Nup50 [Phodopus roborovskii]|uniref:Nuclear pore complex protein Nup50 n=1 Tax=Phodopus roborovskii TaxID=109678 RepID=A0AAV0A3H4_PHORO|nr:nuclear pore complex protein Nup50 [Phodopus roborovskii]CAH7171504.1 1700123L14Rik [Phodopus roborovskii]
MAKKNAKKEVTGRNWHQDPEEEGTFSLASQDVLRNRTIKRAKRRHTRLQPDGGGTSKGIKGLAVSSGRGEFSNSHGEKPLEGITTRKNTARAAAEPKAALGSVTANGPASLGQEQTSVPQTNGHNQQAAYLGLSFSQAYAGSVYHRQLTGLNCSVRDWIVKHVNANPFCNLTPVFKQYEKYLVAIEKQLHSSYSCLSEREPNRGLVGTQPPSLVVATKPQPESVASEKTEFIAEKKAGPPQGATITSCNFVKNTESPFLGSLSSGPMSGVSSSTRSSSLTGKGTTLRKPASAKALESPAHSSSDECKGDEPPKVVLTEGKEEGVFYSKKCRLFYKKDNEFKEKGGGILHLKATANQKTQLLVQDTKLGNILLNIMVPPTMPCTRMGRNNVLIVCVPDPPLDKKSATIEVTMLIRVKTCKDAEELHKILLQRKGA